jgi:hypothetical protein
VSDTQTRLDAIRPPLEADATPIGRDWVDYAKALEAELERVTAARDRAVDVANEAYDYDNKLREALREIMQLMIRHDDYRAYKIARAALAGGARAAQENQ